MEWPDLHTVFKICSIQSSILISCLVSAILQSSSSIMEANAKISDYFSPVPSSYLRVPVASWSFVNQRNSLADSLFTTSKYSTIFSKLLLNLFFCGDLYYSLLFLWYSLCPFPFSPTEYDFHLLGRLSFLELLYSFIWLLHEAGSFSFCSWVFIEWFCLISTVH